MILQFRLTGERLELFGSFIAGCPLQISTDSQSPITETFQGFALDRPLFYPPTPFPPDMCTILSGLPPGISELCLSSAVSEQMMYLLASVSVAVGARASSIRTATFTDRTAAVEDFYRPGEIQTILNALQSFSLLQISKIEKLLHVGLVAFCFQLQGLSTLNLFYDPPLLRFIQLISSHDKPSSRQEQHCLMWVSMSVAGALALRTVSMPGSHTVMDHALDFYPEARSWSQLERILQSFLWTDDIGAHWRRSWEVARARKEPKAQRQEGVDLLEQPTDFHHPSVCGREGPKATSCPFISRLSGSVAPP